MTYEGRYVFSVFCQKMDCLKKIDTFEYHRWDYDIKGTYSQ